MTSPDEYAGRHRHVGWRFNRRRQLWERTGRDGEVEEALTAEWVGYRKLPSGVARR